MRLNEYVAYIPVLIDGTPEIVAPTLDVHEDFVQVPHISQPPLSRLQLSSVLGPELPAPLPDGFVGDDDSPLRQELLDVAKAQTESVIQPNGMTDDLRREPVAVIAVCLGLHQRSLGARA
jgi:hypothetical protein